MNMTLNCRLCSKCGRAQCDCEILEQVEKLTRERNHFRQLAEDMTREKNEWKRIAGEREKFEKWVRETQPHSHYCATNKKDHWGSADFSCNCGLSAILANDKEAK